MKKLKPGLIVALFLLFLCSCGLGISSENSPIIPDQSDPANTEDSSSGNSDIISGIVVEDDTTPPAPGMVRSRLTNEWVDEEVAKTRPIAVIIPNERAAIPHYSLSKASILYEANVEGRMTRMMGIFEDWEDIEKLGNIRSLRTYFAYWAFEWDAFLIHFGGPFFIHDLIAQETTQNIDGSSGGVDATAFFRSTDRSDPHNAYLNGPKLLNAIQEKNYDLEYRGLTEENHFQFVDKSNPNTLAQYGTDAKSAIYIDLSNCYPLTRCYFEYNERTGLYYRSQHLSGATDSPHNDAVNNEQLTFKNILVQYTRHEDLGEGYIAIQCHDDTQDGWFFTNGKGIHVTWKKAEDYGATRFYDDNGDEISLNTGKTMICIVDEGDSFAYR